MFDDATFERTAQQSTSIFAGGWLHNGRSSRLDAREMPAAPVGYNSRDLGQRVDRKLSTIHLETRPLQKSNLFARNADRFLLPTTRCARTNRTRRSGKVSPPARESSTAHHGAITKLRDHRSAGGVSFDSPAGKLNKVFAPFDRHRARNPPSWSEISVHPGVALRGQQDRESARAECCLCVMAVLGLFHCGANAQWKSLSDRSWARWLSNSRLAMDVTKGYALCLRQ